MQYTYALPYGQLQIVLEKIKHCWERTFVNLIKLHFLPLFHGTYVHVIKEAVHMTKIQNSFPQYCIANFREIKLLLVIKID